MDKAQSLTTFHLNCTKAGRILNTWRVEAGMTFHDLESETGIPEQSIKNIFYGKVQDLSMERGLKFCVALNHCPCELYEAVLDGENIDFGHKIHVLRDPTKVKVPMFPASPQTNPAEPASDALLNRFKRLYESIISQLHEQISQLKEARGIIIDQHNQQIEFIHRQHSEQIKTLTDRHSEVMGRVDDEIKHLHKQIARLRTALVIETSAIGILFFVDALVGDRGWILRSLFDLGGRTGYITKG